MTAPTAASVGDAPSAATAAADLTILIPAFNEEKGLPPTLEALLAEPRLAGAKVIVIDDGSTDRTAEVVARFAPRVSIVRHKRNQGYGAGIKTGARFATTTWVAWFDADGQHRATDLAAMLDVARKEQYDAVFGARTTGSAVVKSRVVGKKVLGIVADFVAEQAIPDINCGLRLFRRELLLNYLPLLPDGFSASTTTTLLFIKRNRHFAFHPIVVDQRVGKSTVKQVRDGMRTLHLMMRILFLFQAFKSFAILATFFFVTGVAYGLVMAVVTGRGFPVLGLLFALVGVIVFCFGIVSDQISALRLDLMERGTHESDWRSRTRAHAEDA